MENIFSVTRWGEFTRLQTSLQKRKKERNQLMVGNLFVVYIGGEP